LRLEVYKCLHHIPEFHFPDNVDTREFWLNWLKINNFYSAVSGYQNLSYNHNIDGGAFGKDNYITLVISDNNPPLILEDTTNLN
jgi:hypothetical protein